MSKSSALGPLASNGCSSLLAGSGAKMEFLNHDFNIHFSVTNRINVQESLGSIKFVSELPPCDYLEVQIAT